MCWSLCSALNICMCVASKMPGQLQSTLRCLPPSMAMKYSGCYWLDFLVLYSYIFQFAESNRIIYIWVKLTDIFRGKKNSLAVHCKSVFHGFQEALGWWWWSNFHVQSTPHLKYLLCSLLHPWPDLIAKPPERVELEDGIQPLYSFCMVEFGHQHVWHSFRDLHRTQQEHGG